MSAMCSEIMSDWESVLRMISESSLETVSETCTLGSIGAYVYMYITLTCLSQKRPSQLPNYHMPTWCRCVLVRVCVCMCVSVCVSVVVHVWVCMFWLRDCPAVFSGVLAARAARSPSGACAGCALSDRCVFACERAAGSGQHLE